MRQTRCNDIRTAIQKSPILTGSTAKDFLKEEEGAGTQNAGTKTQGGWAGG